MDQYTAPSNPLMMPNDMVDLFCMPHHVQIQTLFVFGVDTYIFTVVGQSNFFSYKIILYLFFNIQTMLALI